MLPTKRNAPPKTVKGRSRKALWLGWMAGLAAQWGRSAQPGITGADLRRQDYSTSTQRMGVRLTERIRAVFRFRWIREIF